MIDYSENSWHYRFWMSTANKACVTNMFVNRKYQSGYYKDNEYIDSTYVPEENFCSYWRSLFLYTFLQLPGLFLVGLFMSYVCIALPLFTAFCFLTGPSDFLAYIKLAQDADLYIGACFLAFYTVGIIMFGLYKLLTLHSKPYTPSVIEQWYDAHKNKFCPTIKFVKEEDNVESK